MSQRRPPKNVLAPNLCVSIIFTITAVESIILNFILNSLTPIAHGIADPTLERIQTARTNLNSNAESVFTPLGGRLQSHLALVMTSD